MAQLQPQTPVTGITSAMPAVELAKAILAASGPTTTLAPGMCPPNFLKGDYPNPDLSALYDGGDVGGGYRPTGNEFYYAKLPAALANATNLIGWPVCVVTVPGKTVVRTTIKGYKKGSPANGKSGQSGFDSFQFAATLPGIFSKDPFNFFFSPTMTGGRRGGSRRRRGRKGRKGSRRH